MFVPVENAIFSYFQDALGEGNMLPNIKSVFGGGIPAGAVTRNKFPALVLNLVDGLPKFPKTSRVDIDITLFAEVYTVTGVGYREAQNEVADMMFAEDFTGVIPLIIKNPRIDLGSNGKVLLEIGGRVIFKRGERGDDQFTWAAHLPLKATGWFIIP